MSVLWKSQPGWAIEVSEMPESNTERMENMQRLRSIAGNIVSKLWEKDIFGELLCKLQQQTPNRMRKSKMQDGTKARPREMYKMWQASQMVSDIATVHKKLRR
jgi:hypothetical protein